MLCEQNSVRYSSESVTCTRENGESALKIIFLSSLCVYLVISKAEPAFSIMYSHYVSIRRNNNLKVFLFFRDFSDILEMPHYIPNVQEMTFGFRSEDLSKGAPYQGKLTLS